MPTIDNPLLNGEANRPGGVSPVDIIDPNFAPAKAKPIGPLAAAAQTQLEALQGQPIVRALPKSSRGFDRKYQNATPESTGIDPTVFAALRAFDLDRAKSGKQPLSAEQTQKVVEAATNRTTPTPVAERSITDVGGNFVSDLADIAKSIPRLPKALYEEGKRALNIGDELAKVDSLADVTRLPGIDLIPGAYTVGNIADGTAGLKEAATHPLFTLLDVLPGAKAAAATTKVAKLSAAENAARIAAGDPIALNRTNPIRDVLSKKIVEGPEGPTVVRNYLGNAAGLVADSRVGQAWTSAFGARTRQTVKPVGIAANELQDLVSSNKPIPDKYASYTPIIESARTTNGILSETVAKKYNIEPERIAQLTDDMQMNPAALDDLPDNEALWVADVRANRAQLDTFLEEAGLLERFNDELYLPADAQKLARTQQTWMGGVGKVMSRTDRLFAKYVDRGGMKVGAFADDLAANGGWTPELAATLPDELRPSFEAYQAWAANPTADTLMDFRKATNKLANGRTRLGASGRVGPAGESGVSSLAEFGNLRKELDKMRKFQRQFEVDATPARYQPAVSDRAIRDYIEYRFGDDATKVDAALTAYHKGLLDKVEGFSATRIPKSVDPVTGAKIPAVKGLYDFFEDSASVWREMKDAGFDPIYVHRVSPDQATAMAYPKVGLSEFRPSSLKERTFDMTPMVKDATVAMQHEAVEVLKSKVTDDLIETVANRVAVPAAEVEARYMRQAERAAALDPSINVRDHLDRIIKKTYEGYDSESIFSGTKPATVATSPEQYIRRTDAKALRQMFKRDAFNLFSQVDPFTGVMRTSLLALSPRWHVYNVLGGAIMLQGQSSWGVWKKLPDAIDAVKKLHAGEDPGLPHDFVSSLGGMERDAAQYQVRTGATLRRIGDQIRHGDDAPGALAAAKEPGPVREGFRKVVGKSYQMNQIVDDVYRTLGYLDGYDTSLAKGMSREEAIQMGMHRASKVLQDMTELTPFESAVMRQIFPFYNFYQHVMRYAVQYPIDHPLRVSITTSLARNEIEMLGGLPHSFLESITWGDPDETGERNGMSLAGLNPFSSTAGLFTLVGWLGSTNPVAKTIIEQLGIDTQSGQPELFPQLGYDEMSGQLTIQTDNPMMQMLVNTIPQSQIALQLLGAKDDYARLKAKNPAAAQRMLASQAGLPILFRTYNPDQKRISSEIQRQEVQTKEEQAALKAGDIDKITGDSRFAETAAKLAALQESGELDAYYPNVYQPSVAQLITGGLGGQFGYQPITDAEQAAYAEQVAVISSTPGNNRVTS
jgi:hypothetical protein